MNILDRVIAGIAPGAALKRARNRAALQAITAHYDAATSGNRGGSWRPVASDADTAARQRQKIAFVARDMVRNTAHAVRLRQVIVANTVGDGIIPKVICPTERRRKALTEDLAAHFDTVAIDAHGRQNLYGLTQLVMGTVVEAGEVLVRRRRRYLTDGLALPFQIEVMEPDFICDTRDGRLTNGNEVRDGIEYDAIGRRVAYWLYQEHPGTQARTRMKTDVRRVPASEILHIYRQDRPGQMRGVSWFAPVAMAMQDLADYADAQLMRQKIAACFVGFRTQPEPDTPAQAAAKQDMSLIPGRIENLLPGEDIKFATPPAAEGFGEFSASVLRAVATGGGVTYEALSGDLTGVNFSSARMGRGEMNRNVSGWQWLMLIPQFLQPLAAWALEAWQVQNGVALPKGTRIEWFPPYRELVDPTREIPALRDKVRAGFASRQSVIRELGYDPDAVMAEIEEDARDADKRKLSFDSDARTARPGASAAPAPAGGAQDDDDDEDGRSAPPDEGQEA